jgi:hypothetical protein
MLFISSPVGFCWNFNRLTLTYIIAVARDEKVYIYEKINSINPKVTILKDILRENDRFIFVKSLDGLEKEKQYDEKIDASFIRTHYTREQKRNFFKECIQLNEKTKERLGIIPVLHAGTAGSRGIGTLVPPPVYDVAVHCRTGDKITWGEMGKIELIDYINEIKKVPDLPENPTIFLMTDNGKVVTEFKSLIPISWKVFTYTKEEVDAYDQFDFNDKTAKQKLAEFYQLLLETEIAKISNAFIGTVSSNVSLHIILTGNHKYIKSLDFDTSILFD